MGSAVTITPDSDPVSITPDPVSAGNRNWLDSATDFAKGVWQQVNPVSGIKGAAQLAAHPIQTYTADASNRQDLLNKAEKEFKDGNYSAGMAHALYGIIPFLGPQMDQAGENIASGKVATGLGQSTGIGLNLSAPAIVKGAGDAAAALAPSDAMEAASRRLYQSALKPPPGQSIGKVNSAVQGGLENAVPVAPESVQKIGDLMSDTNQKIAALVSSDPTKTVNKFSVASRLGNTANRFATQANPEADLNAVANSGNEFLRNQPTEIPAVQAQAVKQGTYAVQGNRAYGELSSAAVESQKALARGLKEELANAFPELSDLNAADSRLINLDDAMERAVKRISNHQLMGIGTPLAAAGAKAVTGSSGLAAVTGMMKAVVDDPFVKSKLAIALYKASKGQIPTSAAQAQLAAYSAALGNAASSQPPDAANSQ
jgi:hypothetical protein